jgi:hypothetical protein
LEAKARALAGIKGYKTNLAATPDGEPVTADFVISSYHELWRIEKSFRMSKSDLQARPIYHRKRDSIEAHLTIVFATLEYVDWYNHRRLYQACGDIPPAELEAAYYRQNAALTEAGQTTT